MDTSLPGYREFHIRDMSFLETLEKLEDALFEDEAEAVRLTRKAWDILQSGSSTVLDVDKFMLAVQVGWEDIQEPSYQEEKEFYSRYLDN